LQILIPRHEVDENPSYWDHPLRYLWGLLAHAEASTRQFVESQVSLWCLEQEVREGTVRSKAKFEALGGDVGRDESRRRRRKSRIEDETEEEVKKGVEELKERVAAVEEQWAEGLGAEFERVRLGVRAFLMQTGGWDDELEEGV